MAEILKEMKDLTNRVHKSLECAICLEILVQPYSTKCNHQFCRKCLDQLLSKRKKKSDVLCPLCKDKILKRGLTENIKLGEIVHAVRNVIDALEEDFSSVEQNIQPNKLQNGIGIETKTSNQIEEQNTEISSRKCSNAKETKGQGINKRESRKLKWAEEKKTENGDKTAELLEALESASLGRRTRKPKSSEDLKKSSSAFDEDGKMEINRPEKALKNMHSDAQERSIAKPSKAAKIVAVAETSCHVDDPITPANHCSHSLATEKDSDDRNVQPQPIYIVAETPLLPKNEDEMFTKEKEVLNVGESGFKPVKDAAKKRKRSPFADLDCKKGYQEQTSLVCFEFDEADNCDLYERIKSRPRRANVVKGKENTEREDAGEENLGKENNLTVVAEEKKRRYNKCKIKPTVASKQQVETGVDATSTKAKYKRKPKTKFLLPNAMVSSNPSSQLIENDNSENSTINDDMKEDAAENMNDIEKGNAEIITNIEKGNAEIITNIEKGSAGNSKVDNEIEIENTERNKDENGMEEGNTENIIVSNEIKLVKTDDSKFENGMVESNLDRINVINEIVENNTEKSKVGNELREDENDEFVVHNNRQVCVSRTSPQSLNSEEISNISSQSSVIYDQRIKSCVTENTLSRDASRPAGDHVDLKMEVIAASMSSSIESANNIINPMEHITQHRTLKLDIKSDKNDGGIHETLAAVGICSSKVNADLEADAKFEKNESEKCLDLGNENVESNGVLDSVYEEPGTNAIETEISSASPVSEVALFSQDTFVDQNVDDKDTKDQDSPQKIQSCTSVDLFGSQGTTENATDNVTGNVKVDITDDVKVGITGNVTDVITGDATCDIKDNVTDYVKVDITDDVKACVTDNVTDVVTVDATTDFAHNVTDNGTEDFIENVTDETPKCAERFLSEDKKTASSSSQISQASISLLAENVSLKKLTQETLLVPKGDGKEISKDGTGLNSSTEMDSKIEFPRISCKIDLQEKKSSNLQFAATYHNLDKEGSRICEINYDTGRIDTQLAPIDNKECFEKSTGNFQPHKFANVAFNKMSNSDSDTKSAGKDDCSLCIGCKRSIRRKPLEVLSVVQNALKSIIGCEKNVAFNRHSTGGLKFSWPDKVENRRVKSLDGNKRPVLGNCQTESLKGKAERDAPIEICRVNYAATERRRVSLIRGDDVAKRDSDESEGSNNKRRRSKRNQRNAKASKRCNIKQLEEKDLNQSSSEKLVKSDEVSFHGNSRSIAEDERMRNDIDSSSSQESRHQRMLKRKNKKVDSVDVIIEHQIDGESENDCKDSVFEETATVDDLSENLRSQKETTDSKIETRFNLEDTETPLDIIPQTPPAKPKQRNISLVNQSSALENSVSGNIRKKDSKLSEETESKRNRLENSLNGANFHNQGKTNCGFDHVEKKNTNYLAKKSSSKIRLSNGLCKGTDQDKVRDITGKFDFSKDNPVEMVSDVDKDHYDDICHQAPSTLRKGTDKSSMEHEKGLPSMLPPKEQFKDDDTLSNPKKRRLNGSFFNLAKKSKLAGKSSIGENRSCNKSFEIMERVVDLSSQPFGEEISDAFGNSVGNLVDGIQEKEELVSLAEIETNFDEDLPTAEGIYEEDVVLFEENEEECQTETATKGTEAEKGITEFINDYFENNDDRNAEYPDEEGKRSEEAKGILDHEDFIECERDNIKTDENIGVHVEEYPQTKDSSPHKNAEDVIESEKDLFISGDSAFEREILEENDECSYEEVLELSSNENRNAMAKSLPSFKNLIEKVKEMDGNSSDLKTEDSEEEEEENLLLKPYFELQTDSLGKKTDNLREVTASSALVNKVKNSISGSKEKKDSDKDDYSPLSPTPPPRLALKKRPSPVIDAALKEMKKLLQNNNNNDNGDKVSRKNEDLKISDPRNEVLKRKVENETCSENSRFKTKQDFSADSKALVQGNKLFDKNTNKEEIVAVLSTPPQLKIGSPLKAPQIVKEIIKTPIINSELRKQSSLNNQENLLGNGVTIIPSRLKRKEMSYCKAMADKMGGRFSSVYVPGSTHLVMGTDEYLAIDRSAYTYKYLMALITGSWIVGFKWVLACLKSGKLVAEENFEVKGDPSSNQEGIPRLARISKIKNEAPLFSQLTLSLLGNFKSSQINKEQLIQILRICGAKVIFEIPKEIPGKNYLLITDNESLEAGLADRCLESNIQPVHFEWIMESIINYKVQDPTPFLLNV